MSREYLFEVLVKEYGFSADVVYNASDLDGFSSTLDDLCDQNYPDWDDAA